MRSVAHPWGLLVCGVLASSCGAGTADPDLEQLFVSAPYGRAECDDSDGRLAGQREVRLFQGGDLAGDDGDLSNLTRGLARYYRRHSLSFFTRGAPRPTSTAYALDTDQAALDSALQAAFPGVDVGDEASLMADPALWNEVVQFTASFLLRPMVDFVRANSTGAEDVTSIVLVPELERPGGSGLGGTGATLAGLAISPPLLAELARTMSDEWKTWQSVGLPTDFSPVMFLGRNAIRSLARQDPELRELVVAHEFGHTGGLAHAAVAGNLMFPSSTVGRDDCTNSLTDVQLAALRTNLGLAPETGALTGRRGTELDHDAAHPPRPRFSPADLRSLRAGDAHALRRLLGSLVHDEPAPGP
jgi:hypothetical protein